MFACREFATTSRLNLKSPRIGCDLCSLLGRGVAKGARCPNLSDYHEGILMQARIGFAFAIALVSLLAGCGGKDEVKKNEGKIVNVAPTAATPPGGAAPASGSPAAANQPLPPPPIPKINE